MVDKIRKLIPQAAINKLWHFPKAVSANLKYGFPSKGMIVIGVTGTDGKTTTVNMIYKILKDAGKSVSMISTIYAEIGGERLETGFHVTSPDPSDVQKFIKMARDKGSEYMVLEVTSHAIDQYRFWGVRYDYGVITNITHEHLDYHKTFENYLQTKAKLIKNTKVAVLNQDDPGFEKLKKLARGKVVSFSLTKKSDLNPDSFPLKLKLPGDYNRLNALAASAVVLELGIDQRVIKNSLEEITSFPGRMEEVKNNKGVKIFVDFAHTPNALEKALTALRAEAKGNRIIAVFGAAGFRDTEKRPVMGETAAKLADYVVITSEDPRGLIEKINKQILEGVKKAGGKVGENIFVENDREKAISFAINKLAKRGDIVGIFGKGHETSMNLDGKNEVPWSDRQAVEKALKNE